MTLHQNTPLVILTVADRVSENWGLNAKMSEYSAAVALADLRILNEKKKALNRRAYQYKRGLRELPGIKMQDGFGDSWIGTFLNVWMEDRDIEILTEQLKTEGIEVRAWWGKGLHRHPQFASLERTNLNVTDQISKTFIGLPFWPDLPYRGIKKVIEALSKLSVGSDV